MHAYNNHCCRKRSRDYFIRKRKARAFSLGTKSCVLGTPQVFYNHFDFKHKVYKNSFPPHLFYCLCVVGVECGYIFRLWLSGSLQEWQARRQIDTAAYEGWESSVWHLICKHREDLFSPKYSAVLPHLLIWSKVMKTEHRFVNLESHIYKAS